MKSLLKTDCFHKHAHKFFIVLMKLLAGRGMFVKIINHSCIRLLKNPTDANYSYTKQGNWCLSLLIKKKKKKKSRDNLSKLLP